MTISSLILEVEATADVVELEVDILSSTEEGLVV